MFFTVSTVGQQVASRRLTLQSVDKVKGLGLDTGQRVRSKSVQSPSTKTEPAVSIRRPFLDHLRECMEKSRPAMKREKNRFNKNRDLGSEM